MGVATILSLLQIDFSRGWFRSWLSPLRVKHNYISSPFSVERKSWPWILLIPIYGKRWELPQFVLYNQDTFQGDGLGCGDDSRDSNKTTFLSPFQSFSRIQVMVLNSVNSDLLVGEGESWTSFFLTAKKLFKWMVWVEMMNRMNRTNQTEYISFCFPFKRKLWSCVRLILGCLWERVTSVSVLLLLLRESLTEWFGSWWWLTRFKHNYISFLFPRHKSWSWVRLILICLCIKMRVAPVRL